MKPLNVFINESSDELNALFRYLKDNERDDEFAFKHPVRKRGELLFHFSGPDEATDIMKNGFKIGTSLRHLHNTETGANSDETGKYNFAYDFATVKRDLKGCTAYGEYMVVFVSDCVICRHQYDEDKQAIFINRDAKPVCALHVDYHWYTKGQDYVDLITKENQGGFLRWTLKKYEDRLRDVGIDYDRLNFNNCKF